jgi:nucleoid-associated protein YgaU
MTSRYSNTPRTWAPHPTRGWVQVTHRAPNIWNNQVYTDYLSTDFDTFVNLSVRNYGDPNLYWGIAEMNPEVLCPDDLRAGVILQLPAGPR